MRLALQSLVVLAALAAAPALSQSRDAPAPAPSVAAPPGDVTVPDDYAKGEIRCTRASSAECDRKDAVDSVKPISGVGVVVKPNKPPQ